MTTQDQLDETISKWLEADAAGQLPDRVLRTTFERTLKSRQRRGRRALSVTLHVNRTIVAVAGVAMVVVASAGLGLYANQRGVGFVPPSQAPSPTLERSPTATAVTTNTPVQLAFGAGTPLGWSRDGTRLLFQTDDWTLSVLRADGSETQLTNQLSGLEDFFGSGAPGATISPDGSRVVFAGLTKQAAEARFCHDGALFAVDADGGPAELLWKSHVPQNGIVRHPMFSPDGTQIAFADGFCDRNHSLWLMNADGSDAHQIVSAGPLAEAGHVRNLAWSATGDRIALMYDDAVYTFAKDGSDPRETTDTSMYCWPGRLWLGPDGCSR